MATRRKEALRSGTETRSPVQAAGAENLRPAFPFWSRWLIGLAALVIAFILYGPSLRGPFLFDDIGLPFYPPAFATESLAAWLRGVRPVLMLSYWVNFQMSGRDPWTYHVVNVLLHSGTSLLVFIFFLRVLRQQQIQERRVVFCAAFAGLVFLVHPVQTEAVAYIAGRSELVCGLFSMAALTLFCGSGPDGVRWRTASLILALYAAAVLSKEQAVVLPALFLAIDLFLRGRSVSQALRKNARLYYPVALLGVLGAGGVLVLLARSSTAGFHVAGITWHEYLFTQFRVWWLYLRLAVVPLGQNADYDLALSHTWTDHGSAIAATALLAVALLAWRARRRFPLAFAGLLMFAVLLLPTSSFIPIQDVAAERRLYLPLAGLLLAFAQVLSRVRLGETLTAALVTAVMIYAGLTHQRSKVWSSDIALWLDTVTQSPGKARGHTHLTWAYIRSGQCANAVAAVQRVPEKTRDSPELLGMLGQAYLCEHKLNDAVNAFERAVQAGPGVGRYLALASVYRQVGREWDAKTAEEQALRMPPRTAYDFTLLDAYQKTRN